MSKDQITEQTKVSLRTTVAIVSVVLGVALWQNNELNAIKRGVDASWKVSDQQIWSERLKMKNPVLSVPSVEAVRSGFKDREVMDRSQTLGRNE